jgi:hypothetical protein
MGLLCGWFDSLEWACYVAGLIHWNGPVMWLVGFTGMGLLCGWFDSLEWACYVAGLIHWNGSVMWLV